MPYLMVEVDVLAPFPEVLLGPCDTGVAMLVRRGGRPVGFVLEPLAAGTRLSSDEVDLLAGRAADSIVREALLDELGRGEPTEPPSLTVAICTRDRVDLLTRCLTHLREHAQGVDVLVVDNAPPDSATRRLVEQLPHVRYAVEPLPGLDFARNRALREATGDVVAFLDDDVVVDRGWLAGLREAWSLHPDAGAVTGQVLPLELDTDAQIAFEANGGFRRGFHMVRYAGPVLAGNPLFPYGAGMFGAGCNMSYRRDVALALGGFDEALDTGAPLPGGGDLDMFHRVLRSGAALVYAPSCLAFHQHRREHAALRRQLYTWGTGHMAFVDKTYRADPEGRPQLRRLVAWQLSRQLRETVSAARGKSPLPVDVALAELRGSLVGLTGTYRRSVRRSAAARSQR